MDQPQTEIVKTEVKLSRDELVELQLKVPGGENLDRSVLIRLLLGLSKRIDRNNAQTKEKGKEK